jgi:enoyl-CoA hydratase/carnithine racemase
MVAIDNPPRLDAMTRQMLADLGRLWDELERGAILAFCRERLAQGAGAARLTLGEGSAANDHRQNPQAEPGPRTSVPR